jgi:hypothetical protein
MPRLSPSAALPLLAAAVLALAPGCASTPSGGRGKQFDWFAASAPGEDDVWYPKVEEWQGRARAEGTRLPKTDRGPRSAEFSGQLLQVMGSFRDEERRAFAERVHHWAQRIARKHYKFDPGNNDPIYDRWPTVGELLANNGDDCDGLDLIAYQLLREFGFPPEQLYRGILRRNRDNANHMVTLWFESPGDPWVLDATGAVAIEFHRVSELPGWTPTKLFNESTQWNVVEKTDAQPVAASR